MLPVKFQVSINSKYFVCKLLQSNVIEFTIVYDKLSAIGGFLRSLQQSLQNIVVPISANGVYQFEPRLADLITAARYGEQAPSC